MPMEGTKVLTTADGFQGPSCGLTLPKICRESIQGPSCRISGPVAAPSTCCTPHSHGESKT